MIRNYTMRISCQSWVKTHSAPDVLLFSLLDPLGVRLSTIGPQWKSLRSLALKGRRSENWAEIEQAVERATAYWNQNKHAVI